MVIDFTAFENKFLSLEIGTKKGGLMALYH